MLVFYLPLIIFEAITKSRPNEAQDNPRANND